MELELSDDQAFFLETTRKFLAAECPLTAVRALEHDPSGYDPAVWRRGAELGWTSLLVAEADGGGSFSEHGPISLHMRTGVSIEGEGWDNYFKHGMYTQVCSHDRSI